MSTQSILIPTEPAAGTTAWSADGPRPTPVRSQRRDGHPHEPHGLADWKIRDVDERAVTVQ